WLDLFRQRYGARIAATECARTSGIVGVHSLPIADRVRLGTEMMIDSYIALRCGKFIGNGHSNVSAMIAILKNWGNDLQLVEPSWLGQRIHFHRGSLVMERE